MTKELDLEIYDIVKIVDGNGSIWLESINEIHNDENGKVAFTDNFVIDLKEVEVICESDGDPYQLEMVWRLDGNRNYTIIYPIQRLESIDNTKPSEALKELNEIIEYITEDKKVKYKATILFDCEIIKDALLKAQKQEQAFKLINKKLVDLSDVRYCLNYEHYKKGKSKEFDTKIVKIDWNDNVLLDCLNLLTQEEFDLLKEALSK